MTSSYSPRTGLFRVLLGTVFLLLSPVRAYKKSKIFVEQNNQFRCHDHCLDEIRNYQRSKNGTTYWTTLILFLEKTSLTRGAIQRDGRLGKSGLGSMLGLLVSCLLPRLSLEMFQVWGADTCWGSGFRFEPKPPNYCPKFGRRRFSNLNEFLFTVCSAVLHYLSRGHSKVKATVQGGSTSSKPTSAASAA